MSKSSIVIIISALLLVVFSIQNAGNVELNLFFWKVNGSLALMLILVFLLGAITGYFVRMASELRRNKMDTNTATVDKTTADS